MKNVSYVLSVDLYEFRVAYEHINDGMLYQHLSPFTKKAQADTVVHPPVGRYSDQPETNH